MGHSGARSGVVVEKATVPSDESPSLENEIRGQGVFVSRYVHHLDPKRRLTIPSEWRAQISSPRSLYVLPDVHHKCLCVFPAAEMMRRLNAIRHHSVADRRARDFARVLASQSDLVAWDSQGRIRIKDNLLDYAELKDEVIMVGAFDYFELWSPPQFEAALKTSPISLQDAAQYVGF